MHEIREIYQRWLDGALAQEDALFAIGDVLQRAPAADAPAMADAEQRCAPSAAKSSQRA
jgi:hypothetical protein